MLRLCTADRPPIPSPSLAAFRRLLARRYATSSAVDDRIAALLDHVSVRLNAGLAGSAAADTSANTDILGGGGVAEAVARFDSELSAVLMAVRADERLARLQQVHRTVLLSPDTPSVRAKLLPMHWIGTWHWASKE